jgi:hypothetical protein
MDPMSLEPGFLSLHGGNRHNLVLCEHRGCSLWSSQVVLSPASFSFLTSVSSLDSFSVQLSPLQGSVLGLPDV